MQPRIGSGSRRDPAASGTCLRGPGDTVTGVEGWPSGRLSLESRADPQPGPRRSRAPAEREKPASDGLGFAKTSAASAAPHAILPGQCEHRRRCRFAGSCRLRRHGSRGCATPPGRRSLPRLRGCASIRGARFGPPAARHPHASRLRRLGEAGSDVVAVKGPERERPLYPFPSSLNFSRFSGPAMPSWTGLTSINACVAQRATRLRRVGSVAAPRLPAGAGFRGPEAAPRSAGAASAGPLRGPRMHAGYAVVEQRDRDLERQRLPGRCFNSTIPVFVELLPLLRAGDAVLDGPHEHQRLCRSAGSCRLRRHGSRGCATPPGRRSLPRLRGCASIRGRSLRPARCAHPHARWLRHRGESGSDVVAVKGPERERPLYPFPSSLNFSRFSGPAMPSRMRVSAATFWMRW